MSNIHVPHLQSHYFSHADDEMIVLPTDKHRTHLSIQDTDSQTLHIWIGLNPPADIDEWFSLGGSTERDTITFTRGVYGPIYMSEAGGNAGDAFILSNLIENATVEPLPT